MKAKKLAEILLQHPDRIVVKSCDDEGNGFSIVDVADTEQFYWQDDYEGYIKTRSELEDEDFDYFKPAIVLW